MLSQAKTHLFDDFNQLNKVCLKYSEAPVYFLLSQKGEAIVAHVAADGRDGRKGLRDVCRYVMGYVPKNFPWCKMLIAPVDKKSVYNLCIKLGFEDGGLVGNEAGQFNMMVVSYG